MILYTYFTLHFGSVWVIRGLNKKECHMNHRELGFVAAQCLFYLVWTGNVKPHWKLYVKFRNKMMAVSMKYASSIMKRNEIFRMEVKNVKTNEYKYIYQEKEASRFPSFKQIKFYLHSVECVIFSFASFTK